jgi:hypothetical protein
VDEIKESEERQYHLQGCIAGVANELGSVKNDHSIVFSRPGPRLL